MHFLISESILQGSLPCPPRFLALSVGAGSTTSSDLFQVVDGENFPKSKFMDQAHTHNTLPT